MTHKLSDQNLLHSLHLKVKSERQLNLEIIELLEEVDRRKLFLKMGFGSLLEFCVKELKYSESSAYRRISAMRVVRDVPEVKESLEKGRLNLVTVSQAQTFFNQECKYNQKIYTREEKRDLLNSIENKSKKECDRILIEKSPELSKKERVKVITARQTQVTLTIDEELMEKLERVKSLISHKNPNPTYVELINELAELALRKLDPEKRSRENKRDATPLGGVHKSRSKNQRYIPKKLRDHVWRRDEGKCCYQDPGTKRRCGSRFQLQLDHIKPISIGGESNIENLRLLCANHNRFRVRASVSDS